MLRVFNKKFTLGVIIFSVAGALYATIYGRIQKYKMSVLPHKIVYYPNRKIDNPVFFIRDLKYKKEYLDYVNKDLNNYKDRQINFPFQNNLGGGVTIYIRKYLRDSVLVEFYNPDYHNRIWGFKTGYIHRVYIHDTLRKE